MRALWIFISAFLSMGYGRAFAVKSHGNQNVKTTYKNTSVFAVRDKLMKIKGGSVVGTWYASQLATRPIVTKSVTAALIFAASDASAQTIENKGNEEQKRDNIRTLVSSLVGLLYFGPAAHYWYDMIFKILPGTSLISTLQKATLGQLIFGPSFTCVFFAISLFQAKSFTLGNFIRKVKADLPGAWKAGLGFWYVKFHFYIPNIIFAAVSLSSSMLISYYIGR